MKSKVKTIIALIGIVLCAASISMLFFPAAISDKLSLSGWNLIYLQFEFRYGQQPTDVLVLTYGTSIVAVILVFLLVLGSIFSVASLGQRFANNKPSAKIFGIISLVCLILSAVLFFLLKVTCKLPDNLPDIALPPDFILPDVRKSAFSLGIGAIIGGITSILGAACCAIALFVPTKE